MCWLVTEELDFCIMFPYLWMNERDRRSSLSDDRRFVSCGCDDLQISFFVTSFGINGIEIIIRTSSDFSYLISICFFLLDIIL